MDPPIGPPVRLNPNYSRQASPPPPSSSSSPRSGPVGAPDAHQRRFRNQWEYTSSQPQLLQEQTASSSSSRYQQQQRPPTSRPQPQPQSQLQHHPFSIQPAYDPSSQQRPPRPRPASSRTMVQDQFLQFGGGFPSPSTWAPSPDSWNDAKGTSTPQQHQLFYAPPVFKDGGPSSRPSISTSSDWSNGNGTSPSSFEAGLPGANSPSSVGAKRPPSPGLPATKAAKTDATTAALTASHSANGPAPHTHLKKQQACLTCKRRKTRCDAVRPTCGACSRSQARAARGHALTAEVPPGPCCYPDDDPNPDSTDSGEASGGPNAAAAQSPTRRTAKKRKSTNGDVQDSKTDSNPVPQPGHHHAQSHSLASLLSSASTDSPSSERQSTDGSQDFRNRLSPSTAGTSISIPSSAEIGHALLSAQHSPWSDNVRVSQAPGSGQSPETKRFIIEVQSGSGGRARIQRYYKRDPARTATGEHPNMSLDNLLHPMRSSNLDGQPDPLAFDDGFNDVSADTQWMNLDSSSLPQVDLMLRELWPELSPDLPTPDTIKHMAQLFFAKHPCRTMFSEGTMMARLMLPPGHTLRPHPALIHALLAAAEPFSPLVPSMKDTNPLTRNDQGQATSNGNGTSGTWADAYNGRPQPTGVDVDAFEASGRGLLGISNPMEMPRPEISARNLSFGEFHLGKARREIEIAALTQNQRPLEWIQASVLIAYCLLDRCRIMELFFLTAAMVRTISPVGLDKIPNDVDSPEWGRSLIGRPESSIMHYEQRMALWHIYLADSYGAGPPRWYEPCIADETNQITTTMPILMPDVRDESEVKVSNQTLSSPNLFCQGHTDTFALHVKSACLLKKARTLTSRKGSELQRIARPSAEVIIIDNYAKELLASFLKRQQGGSHDADWIVAEANTCIARITLHSYFINFDSTAGAGAGGGGGSGGGDESFGLGPITQCADMMLRTVHDLLASSFDLNLLHTQTFICWTVLVRTLEVQMRTLQKSTLVQLQDQAQHARNAIASVMTALAQASERSTRAKTSLDICRAICESELTDDEFSDLVFLWQVIPAV